MGTIIDSWIEKQSEEQDKMYLSKMMEEDRIKAKSHQFDISYLKMAKIWAENSYAIRRKVGCLIVKDGMIISDGFNGTISNMNNACEYIEGREGEEVSIEELIHAQSEGKKLITKDDVIHSEMNALMKVAKSSQSCKGATIYISLEPCQNCAKHLIMAGIKRVVYSDSYRKHEGIELLKRANIEVEQIKID